MNNTCKNCKFWERESHEEFEKPKCYGQCSNPAFVYGPDSNNYPKNGLTYWDSEAYAAGFRTGEDFGCIHFLEKIRVST